MADLGYDTRLEDGAGTRVRLVMADKLSEAQSALDEAAGRGELKEGTYIDISNKFKECIEDRDNDIKRAKVNMFITVTRHAPQLVGSPMGGVWPLGCRIIEMVTKSARTNKVPPRWWLHAMLAYCDAIFEDSKPVASVRTRMEALIDLAEHLYCVQNRVLYDALTQKNKCFMCEFMYDVGHKKLYSFAEDVILRAPYLICNVKACDTHCKTGFTMLKNIARTEACTCTWKDCKFLNAVGPRFPRRSKRVRTKSDSDDEIYAEASADMLCCLTESA